MLREKFKTAAWFPRRPDHCAFALALAARKAKPGFDTPELRSQARNWTAERAGGVREALAGIGLLAENAGMPAYPRLWSSLAPGGILISDDIQDNMAVASFFKARSVRYSVTGHEGKYVGTARKPAT